MLNTVKVPKQFEPIFEKAQEFVGKYFRERKEDPTRGTIEVFGQRYILVRAASMSVEFFEMVASLYAGEGEAEAYNIARQLLFDIAHAIGRQDAKNFHEKMNLRAPIEKLSAGPVHFAHAGWAFVDIFPESAPSPDENYYLIYDHPYSFESDAWLAANKKPDFPVCIMNSGYSSGWCEESFGVDLVATEIMCVAKGDPACRFIMAPPSRIEGRIAAYMKKVPELADKITNYEVPGFFRRKEVEEELRRSEERYRNLIESARDIIFTLSPDGTITSLNRAFEEITGWPRSEWVGRNFGEGIVHPEDWELAARRVQELFTGNIPPLTEVRFRAKSGEYIRGEFIMNPSYREGKITEILGIGRDVTERKRAEEALRQANIDLGLFRALLDNSSDAIEVLDPVTLRFLDVNAKACLELGYSRDELLSMSIPDIDPCFNQGVNEMIDKQMQKYGTACFEGIHRRRDGRTFPVEINSSLVQLDKPYVLSVVRDITERKKAEDEIIKQQKLTSQIIETIPMRVFWKDRDSLYLGCNTLFAKDAGLNTPGDLTNKSDYEMGWKDQAELYRADDRRVMESGNPRLSYDEPQTTPDGNQVWLRTSKVPLRNELNEVFGVLGIYEDITTYKQMELKLRESEERFRKAFENSAIGMALVGLDGRWLRVNNSLCRIVGYTGQELLNKTFQEITHPDDMETDLGYVNRLLSGEIDHYRMEKRYIHKDGHIVWILLSVSLIRDAQDKPSHFVSQVEDITGNKLAIQALEESENKLKAILEAAVDGVLVADAESHRFILGNRAICGMLGYSQDEIALIRVSDIHPAEAMPEIEEQFAKQARGEMQVAPSLPVKRKDGTVFYADVSSSPITIAGHLYLVGIFHDVTERKAAEEKIKKLNEELELKVRERTQQLIDAQGELIKKEKLSTLGQIAGSVGHELRNPLGVMSNAVYFLRAVLPDADDTVKEYLGIIEDEIANSDRIVSDLLDSVRTKPPQAQLITPGELIETSLSKCKIPGNIEVAVDAGANISLKLDPMQMGQVFINLIKNACEAMPDGGRLEIKADTENENENKIVKFRFKDTGTGIAPGDFPKLFTPLFTTKAKGVGLGLVVIKNLTEANGGHVEVSSLSSGAGHGTVFTLRFPAGAERDD